MFFLVGFKLGGSSYGARDWRFKWTQIRTWSPNPERIHFFWTWTGFWTGNYKKKFIEPLAVSGTKEHRVQDPVKNWISVLSSTKVWLSSTVAYLLFFAELTLINDQGMKSFILDVGVSIKLCSSVQDNSSLQDLDPALTYWIFLDSGLEIVYPSLVPSQFS